MHFNETTEININRYVSQRSDNKRNDFCLIFLTFSFVSFVIITRNMRYNFCIITAQSTFFFENNLSISNRLVTYS